MKAILLLFLLVVTISAVLSAPQDHCDCHYQTDKGGCVITRGPSQAGFKCRCRISRFVFFTHCVGTKIGCNAGENCPAGCASLDCCRLANGDCGGY